MIEDKLCQIGFNRSEAKVYLELLKIGPQAGATVAKRAGLNRTTAYAVLKALEKKGVLACSKNGGVKFFIPNDPNSLIGYLDRRCRMWEYRRTELLSVIPNLRKLAGNRSFERPDLSFFEGLEGLEHVVYNSLSAKGDFYSVITPNRWKYSRVKDFLKDCLDFRFKNGRIPSRILAPDTVQVRDFFRGKTDDIEVLFVSGHKDIFRNEMDIYEDRVAIFHAEKGDEYGVTINSREIALMYREMFELAWKWLKQSSSMRP